MPATLLLLSLAGCLPTFEAKDGPPDTFTLSAATAAPADAVPTPLAGELALRLPTVRGAADGDHLPVRLPDGRVDVLAGARWATPVDVGLGAVLVDTLRDRRAFSAVLPDSSPFAGRWLLDVEVREFAAQYAAEGAAPTVRVVLVGTLGRSRDRQVLGAVTGTGEVAARRNTRTAIAEAFGAATREAVLQVAQETERLAAADAAAR